MIDDPEGLGAFYERHESAVLRFFMERVRSPELACDLTAETFAAALSRSFDPSLSNERAWVLALANTQLLRAYRVGTVDEAARVALKLQAVVLDDRTLDRVWQLRGPDRSDERKPRPSGWVIPGDSGREPVDVTLPAVRDELVAVAGRRHDGRRRRRRWMIAARVALALVTVTWVVGDAIVPDRPASASGTTWLPFEKPGGVSGEFPRLWYLASAPQAPPTARPGRELVTFTTFETGDGTDPECGALAIMGPADALVAVIKGSAPRPAVPACRPEARVTWTPLRDGVGALLVFGPEVSSETRAEASEILDRLELAP